MELPSGEPRRVDAPRDDGSVQQIFRCPTCQVAIYSEYGRPDIRFVRAGTLDDPSQVSPDVHIFTDRSETGSAYRNRCRRSRSTTIGTKCGGARASTASRLSTGPKSA